VSEVTPINLTPFTLDEVVRATNGEWVQGETSLNVRGVVTDTRAMPPHSPEKGSLFVALRGDNFDGHKFLAQAHINGATAAIVDSVENAPQELALVQVESTLTALGDLARAHRQRFSGPVIGVTGSYGKTTTRALLAAALGGTQNSSRVLSTRGNFNNEIGVPLTLFGLDAAEHDFAVLEMAMRGSGQIEYLAQIAEPTIGIITNIGPQHIELLGSEDAIAAAKAELIENLPADGVAFLPADDKYFHELGSKTEARVVSFGQSWRADYRVQSTLTDENGNIRFEIVTRDGSYHVSLPLPGAHNAVNAAAAFAVAVELGIAPEAAIAGLERAEVPGARMRIVRDEAKNLVLIDDSYNAGPNSMKAALQVLESFPGKRRRVAILGAMKELGEFTESEHQNVGREVPECAEILLGVGYEALNLCAAASQEEPGLDVFWCSHARGAAQVAQRIVLEGDVVLIKGSRSVGLEVVVEALNPSLTKTS
jgi:UDP-N-acetylmuramoyl-tripeptide--D-alanyl-D-alanine ligase